jgi:hypothetical protein
MSMTNRMPALMPAPWDVMAGMPTNVLAASGIRVARCDFDGDFSHLESVHNAAFIVLARNAFDVMMRRGWVLDRREVEGKWSEWYVLDVPGFDGVSPVSAEFGPWPDPFTALVEADKLYREKT